MFKGKKNFWIAVGPIIAIMIGYSIYMIYAYSTGRNNDFQRRNGMVLTEAQILEASLPNGNVMNAMEAIAVIRENTEILQEIADGKKRNQDKKDYHWKATAMMDPELKNWKVTFREYEVKPKVICQGLIISSTQEVKDFKCFESKI